MQPSISRSNYSQQLPPRDTTATNDLNSNPERLLEISAFKGVARWRNTEGTSTAAVKVVQLKRFVFACKPLQDRLRSAAAAATKTRLGAELPSKIELEPKGAFARNPPRTEDQRWTRKIYHCSQLASAFLRNILYWSFVLFTQEWREKARFRYFGRRMQRSKKNFSSRAVFNDILKNPRHPGRKYF